jgi:hypothetical protein
MSRQFILLSATNGGPSMLTLTGARDDTCKNGGVPWRSKQFMRRSLAMHPIQCCVQKGHQRGDPPDLGPRVRPPASVSCDPGFGDSPPLPNISAALTLGSGMGTTVIIILVRKVSPNAQRWQ